MSNNNLCKGKHLRIEDRIIIEYGLDQNYPLKEIAERIKKDPTTISKEIKRNRFLKVSKKKENDIQPCHIEEVALKQAYVIIPVLSKEHL